MSRPAEECMECGCPTGRAGAGEDSFYIGDRGPYCEDCYDTPEAQQLLREATPMMGEMA